jgi:hypothetical protein
MNYETLDRKQRCTNNNNNNSDIVINNNRTICYGFNSSETTTTYQSNNERNNESLDRIIGNNEIEIECKKNINIKIYRYKFTDSFIEELYKFSKIHQYDHRTDFKEAWELWIEENSKLILDESTRLTVLGYEGDILNKMFTSARYYFRKKGTEKRAPQMRCTYIGTQKELLDAMDNHINLNVNNSWFKPSNGFTDFCKTHVELLQQEIELLIKFTIIDSNEIKKKIKKTYKNRYFMIINKNS